MLYNGGEARHINAFAKHLDIGRGKDPRDPRQLYQSLHNFSISNPADFWSEVWDYFRLIGVKGKHTLSLPLSLSEGAKYDKGSETTEGKDLCDIRWFEDSKINYAHNILELNLGKDPEAQILCFISEDGSRQVWTAADFEKEVLACTKALRKCGIKKGDVIAAWLANCVYTIIAMLATARIGAIWSSCSPDFGLEAIIDRFSQIKPKLLFTQDYYTYKEKEFSLTQSYVELRGRLDSIEKVVSIPFLDSKGNWDDFIKEGSGYSSDIEEVDFNHPLFIMFSSGTTGKPKCIIHSHGGVLLKHTCELFFHADLHPGEKLFYHTTCGWMMWNWMLSGLLTGAGLVLYDGNPFYPDASRLIKLISEEKVAVAGMGAKIIENLHKNNVHAKDMNLSALRMLCSTGSPLSEHSFKYVYREIKQDICVASISGGTDIIGCFVAGVPSLPVYAGEIQAAVLGMDMRIFDEEGNEVVEEKGELVCCTPFPSIPLGFMGDDKNKTKFRDAYFAKYKGAWTQGDYASITKHDGFIIYGRSDNTLNPGGVRIGTAEIYRQVEKLDEILESIAVSQDWQGDIRFVLFVVLRAELKLDEDLTNKIKRILRANASPRHVPDKIIQVPDVPRTISGKISEAAVRATINNLPLKNTGALANPESLKAFAKLKELRT